MSGRSPSSRASAAGGDAAATAGPSARGGRGRGPPTGRTGRAAPCSGRRRRRSTSSSRTSSSQHLVGHGCVDLEPHRPAEAAPAQLDLDGGEEVVGLLLLEREVGVAGDPEGVRARSISMPGKSCRRWAAITCSSGTKRSPSGSTTNRGSRDGTLTRAKRRSSVVGVADDHRQVEREVGDVGERVTGIDRQRGEDREDPLLEHLDQVLRGRRRRGRPSDESSMPASASSGATRSRKVGCMRAEHDLDAGRGCRAAAGPGVRPSGLAPPTPAATWSFRAATRTWKNSSRFWPKIARNLARSSSGTRSSSARARTRSLKSSHDSSRLRYRTGGSSSPTASFTTASRPSAEAATPRGYPCARRDLSETMNLR